MDVANYTPEFFAAIQGQALRSAREVVPLILELCAPTSVIDFGCGNGVWLSVFREYGVEDVLGIDGAYVQSDTLLIPAEQFRAHDLSEPLRLDRRFDLALSLEVAEHLPAKSAAVFVESLAALAPMVVFSAAIPWQGGTDHVNEQWPDYWADHFRCHGFDPLDCIRPQIWDNKIVRPWYAQNIIVYATAGTLPHVSRASPESLRVVHPDIFASRMASIERSPSLRELLSALPGSLMSAARRHLRRVGGSAGGSA